MIGLAYDTAVAWRSARKHPALSLLIVLTLALGIGANGAMFSVAYRMLFAPLPFTDGERLVTLEQRGAFTNDLPWQPLTLEDLRAETSAFEKLLGYVQLEYALLGQGEPYYATVGIVQHDYFSALGIQPVLGRAFAPEDDVIGAAPVMLLGYEFWQSKFGGDENVVGRSVEMNGVVHTVTGVLPPLPAWPRANAVWIPWSADTIMGDPDFLGRRSDVSSGIIWSVIGKLRVGAALIDAQREVDAFATQFRQRWPDTVPADYQIEVHDLKTLMRGDGGLIFTPLLGLTLLVLFIACANVASLHLARLAVRGQELAVREAVGASPARIVRQLLGESLLYAAAGGVLGLCIAAPMLQLLGAVAATHTALASGLGTSNVLMPTLGVALVAGVGSGLLAAFWRRDVNLALKEGGNRTSASASGTRRRRVLLVLQLALAFVMLTTAALVLLSMRRLDAQHPGYEVQGVVMANFQLDAAYFGELQGIAFATRLLEEVRALPGVESAAIAGAPLLRNPLYGQMSMQVERNGGTEEGSAFTVIVTEDYFSTLGIPLLSGRKFSESDDANAARVAVVNASFEQDYFPDGALGQRVSFREGNWYTIVGVVGNVRRTALDSEDGPAFYQPYRQRPTSLIHLFVKNRSGADTSHESISAAVHRIDPRLALEQVRSLEALRGEWLAPRALVARLIAAAGVLALLISCSGVIGLVSYSVSQRVREIGVRMALGAAPGNILRMFMLQGLRTHLWGLLLGLALMFGVAALLEPLLYHTTGFEGIAWAASAFVLSLAVLMAVYLSAVRAGALDPVTALRHD
ncbi:MAG: ADOP family duplicated permease [Gammaproteobacteria bacterium]